MPENQIIVNALKFLEKGKFRERKPYIKPFREMGVELNGYTFKKELWCYLIWKSTDLGKQPQFKGEPLVKVIPVNVPFDKMEVVLNAQPWTYL